MKKYAMVHFESGQVDYIVSPASSDTYKHDCWYGEHIAKEIDASEANDLFIATKYFKDNQWHTRKPQPSTEHIWKDFKWIVPPQPPKTYAEMRAENYPHIHEQLDKIFHDISSGKLNTEGGFYNALQAVKDKYPKPE